MISIEANERIASLVTEIQNGNDKAFDELYKLTNQRAYFVALEFVKKDEDAQDILQESYIKALSKIKELGKPESFQSWLNQIVANKSKDFLKKKKPTLFEAEENEVFEVLPDEDLDFRPESSLDQNELQRTVMEVLDELNEEKKACVLMMYFEELSVGEIAETLEIPEGTVKTRLFSARKDLKEKFAKRGITSAYSVAPIGVVLWAWRRTSVTTGTAFAASAGSASVLAGVTASGAVAAAGTTAAVAGTAAVSAGAVTAAGSAVATGTGFVAKIAALTVVQKVIAGVSVAAVVAGSTAGVVTVVKNNEKKEEATTTAYIEEITTAPHEETTIAVQSAGSVIGYTMTDVYGNVTGVTVLVNGQNGNTAPTQGEAATSGQETASGHTTTRQSTTRPNSTTTTRPSSTRPNSTTTTRPSSTRPNSTSTTRPSSTRPNSTSTTRPPQTNPPQTNPPETQPSTTKGTATVEISYHLVGQTEKTITKHVESGQKIDLDYIVDLINSANGTELTTDDFRLRSGTVPQTATAGETYSFNLTQK